MHAPSPPRGSPGEAGRAAHPRSYIHQTLLKPPGLAPISYLPDFHQEKKHAREGRETWVLSFSAPLSQALDHRDSREVTAQPSPQDPQICHVALDESLPSPSVKQEGRIQEILALGRGCGQFREADENHAPSPHYFSTYTKFHTLLSRGGEPLRTLPWIPP